MTAPSATVQEKIVAASTQVTRRVEILNADGSFFTSPVTGLVLNDGPLIAGSVNVSLSRAERRTIEVEFDNDDHSLDNYPGGFWYDKIIRAYRGVTWAGGSWETPIGEFLIDSISSPHFPETIRVTGRDYTKKLLVSKFTGATAFPAQTLAARIQAIASPAGITRFNLQATKRDGTTPSLAASTYERGEVRWEVMNRHAVAHGMDLFFDPAGYLTLTEFQDPVTTPQIWTFETGPKSNVASFTRSSNDSRIYNVINVFSTSNEVVPPIYATARNDQASSPTRRALLGDRVYEYGNPMITTVQQAQTIADNFLKIHALEQFEVSLQGIVIPWLEVGNIAEFLPQDVDTGKLDIKPGEPTRYLLTDLTMPLVLEGMSATTKRVTVVG